MEIERRFFKTELRMKGEGENRQIIGHGAVFNQLSEDLGGFREMIMPGAFSDTLDDDVRSLFNHDRNLILGRTLSGTLTLSEDDTGLRYDVDPPKTSYANDLQESIGRGDVNQSSFGFAAMEESWRQPDDTEPLPTRILHKVRLFDVGPVTFPAYPTTSSEVRSKAKEHSRRRATEGRTTKDNHVGRLAIMRRQLDLMEIE